MVHFVHTKNVYIVQNTIVVGTVIYSIRIDMLGHVLSFVQVMNRIVTEVRDYNDCGERHLTNQ